MGEFRYEGHRIEYDSYGEGERVLVLVHGLLMNRHMFERLGPALAERGQRTICVDLLGHGRSDRREDLRLYSMPLFARQVVALLDHLELGSAVVGGTEPSRLSRRPRKEDVTSSGEENFRESRDGSVVVPQEKRVEPQRDAPIVSGGNRP